MTDPLLRLETRIAARADSSGDTSYTAELLGRGQAYVARKFGEEAVELILAGAAEPRGAVIAEAADVLYHLAVLLRARGVSVADIATELERREARSGLEEKASR